MNFAGENPKRPMNQFFETSVSALQADLNGGQKCQFREQAEAS